MNERLFTLGIDLSSYVNLTRIYGAKLWSKSYGLLSEVAVDAPGNQCAPLNSLCVWRWIYVFVDP